MQEVLTTDYLIFYGLNESELPFHQRQPYLVLLPTTDLRSLRQGVYYDAFLTRNGEQVYRFDDIEKQELFQQAFSPYYPINLDGNCFVIYDCANNSAVGGKVDNFSQLGASFNNFVLGKVNFLSLAKMGVEKVVLDGDPYRTNVGFDDLISYQNAQGQNLKLERKGLLDRWVKRYCAYLGWGETDENEQIELDIVNNLASFTNKNDVVVSSYGLAFDDWSILPKGEVEKSSPRKISP